MLMIEEKRTYNTEDFGLKRRNGQIVEILRPLAGTDFYEIRFPDGYVRRAFEAELV